MGNIEEGYSKPDLDFQVINNTIQNYEVSSSSTYDYYRIDLSLNNNANYKIAWSFYGQSQTNIKLTLPNILNLLNLGMEEPTLNNFIVLSSSIIKLEGVKSYKKYIVYVTSPTSKQEEAIVKYESFSK
ncbi:hypothetical protein [Carboxylicivirga sp. RSCT41]|uniref:hypothetical protein n=1 Tax=Carboxylicivirga agarovorans TaxID=3417570 RepID=UPI003D324B11